MCLEICKLWYFRDLLLLFLLFKILSSIHVSYSVCVFESFVSASEKNVWHFDWEHIESMLFWTGCTCWWQKSFWSTDMENYPHFLCLLFFSLMFIIPLYVPFTSVTSFMPRAWNIFLAIVSDSVLASSFSAKSIFMYINAANCFYLCVCVLILHPTALPSTVVSSWSLRLLISLCIGAYIMGKEGSFECLLPTLHPFDSFAFRKTPAKIPELYWILVGRVGIPVLF